MDDITLMNGAAIKVTQLHYVRAVADRGSFSQAAVSLGITQPALSSGIAALERVLGGRLFERTSRGARPTPLGSLLLPPIERILGSVDALLSEASTVSGRGGGPLRMGVSPLIHPNLVARAFESARHSEEGGLLLTEHNLAGLRTALERKELDVVLVPAVGAGAQGCRSRDIDVEPLRYLASGVELSEVEEGPVEVPELAGERQILVAEECGLTIFVRALFDRHDVKLEPYPGAAHSYGNLADWANLGLGGAILPESKLNSTSGVGRSLVDAGKPIQIRYEALWLAQSSRAVPVESLLEEMLAVSGDREA